MIETAQLRMAYIRTARLRLRPPDLGDAPALAALMTPSISRWLARWPFPFTVEMAQARIADAMDGMVQGRTLFCIIERQGVLAGCIGGARLPNTDRASFGFWLGEPHHGRALMQEAAPAFVETLRTSLVLTSVEAACQPDNHASAKVLKACGLHRIGNRIEHVPARNREENVDIWERIWAPQPSSMAPLLA